MAVFTRQIAQAKRMISKYGESSTWRVLTDGTPTDANKPWKPSTSVAVDYTVDIVFLPQTRENRMFAQYIKGSQIASGYVVGYMAQQSFVPSLKDVVIRNGVEYGLQTVDPIEPNGEGACLYILEMFPGS